MIAWLLGSFFVLMFLGVPIGVSLGLSAIGGIVFFDAGSLVTVCQRMFEGINSWALLAIPLYTCAGYTMFMESIATLTLFMPIIFPIATAVGIDPIVLGVLVTVVIGVGLVTPPVGMCIYVACDLMKIKVGSTMKYLAWFILGTFVCIAILIALPQLITIPGMLVHG